MDVDVNRAGLLGVADQQTLRKWPRSRLHIENIQRFLSNPAVHDFCPQ